MFSNAEDVKHWRAQISNLHFGFEQCPPQAPLKVDSPWHSLPVHLQHVPWVTRVLLPISMESFAPVKLLVNETSVCSLVWLVSSADMWVRPVLTVDWRSIHFTCRHAIMCLWFFVYGHMRGFCLGLL